jgi:predicted N-acetyltransferase YhbS
MAHEAVVGGNWQTRIMVGDVPGVLLGPLAVHPSCKGQGVGKALLAASLDVARAAGAGFVLLVGDAPYYGRAGFVRVPHGEMIWPGPVDPHRVLAVEFVPGAVDKARGRICAVAHW